MAGFECIELQESSSKGGQTSDTSLKTDVNGPRYVRVGPLDEEGEPLYRLVGVSRFMNVNNGRPSCKKLLELASAPWKLKPPEVSISFRHVQEDGTSILFAVLEDEDIVDCFRYIACDMIDVVVKVPKRVTQDTADKSDNSNMKLERSNDKSNTTLKNNSDKSNMKVENISDKSNTKLDYWDDELQR